MVLGRLVSTQLVARASARTLSARLAPGSRRLSAVSSARLAARAAGTLAAASTGAGLGLLGLTAYLRSDPPPSEMDTFVLNAYSLATLIPWRPLSRAAGWLHDLRLPPWARPPLLGLYARALGISLADAAPAELRAYESAGALFARRLRPDSRPLDAAAPLLSPVDGLVLCAGPVEPAAAGKPPTLIVKGVSYSLSALLGGGSAHLGRPLHQITIYLAPSDYHGFHAPADAVLYEARHVAGALLSVHPALLQRWHTLATNERLVLSGVWAHGYLALVAVGATGVGSIELQSEPRLVTNRAGALHGAVVSRTLEQSAAPVARGERLGGFRLGSCVVVLFESHAHPAYAVSAGARVRLGEPLVRAFEPRAADAGS
ncbi:hypothetical protein KFE25_010995 [Diacronema lutheri]|uniref:phosphatidylserine decarboxylase n=1 Tax=Diacronema lutheri TaxID=2081491 RepID=A0A8J5X787_DIALT|nr:hypothetical protein KFE25_010995 [Diacronema lutheri]